MKTYTIKKGKNYSGMHFRPLYKPLRMEAKVIIPQSAVYSVEPGEQTGWQKIVGFSRGHHHRNFSARFVWRIIGNHFQIAAYQYDNGNRNVRIMIDQHITDPENFRNTYTMNIEIMQERGLVRYQAFNGYVGEVMFLSLNADLPTCGYALNPYFERPDKTTTGAPHDMLFRFNRLAFAR